MRLRYMTLFWRAGYVSTCSLQRTFLSSEAPHSGKTLESGQNLDYEKKTKSNGDTAAAVRLFEVIQKYAKSRDVQTKTALLKSYCDWGLYDQAMKIVRSIVNTKVYETDSYDLVIKSMIRRGQIEKALQVFEEKLERQQNFPTKTYVGEDVVELIELLLNPKNLIVKGENIDVYRHYRTSQMVFSYIQQIGKRLPIRLIRPIHYWLMCDPHNSWTWQNCTISEAGKCSACGHTLINHAPQEDLHQLQKEIVKLFEIWPKSTFQPTDRNLEYQKNQEVQELKTFVKARGPFDVIIDGWNAMNVRFGTETDKPYPDRLIEVANHFAMQKKNVVVVLSETGTLSTKLFMDLKQVIRDLRTINCHVFVSRFENDDLYLLYAAAMSGLRHVEVVTNDKLRDHRLLLPAEVGWTFSRWARLNCVTFTKEENEKVQFFRHKVDPVVQYNENSWHFPVSDETWRCSRRSQRYKSLF